MKYPDGREEAQWPDGTKLWTDGKGHGVMTFPSGMREIYTPICKVIFHMFFFMFEAISRFTGKRFGHCLRSVVNTQTVPSRRFTRTAAQRRGTGTEGFESRMHAATLSPTQEKNPLKNRSMKLSNRTFHCPSKQCFSFFNVNVFLSYFIQTLLRHGGDFVRSPLTEWDIRTILQADYFGLDGFYLSAER